MEFDKEMGMELRRRLFCRIFAVVSCGEFVGTSLLYSLAFFLKKCYNENIRKKMGRKGGEIR